MPRVAKQVRGPSVVWGDTTVDGFVIPSKGNWDVLCEEYAGAELNEDCMAADAVCWASDPVGVIDGVLLI